MLATPVANAPGPPGLSAPAKLTVGAPVAMLYQPVPAGLRSMLDVIVGAVVSTVIIRFADVAMLPAASVAVAYRVCWPSLNETLLKLQAPARAVAVPKSLEPS